MHFKIYSAAILLVIVTCGACKKFLDTGLTQSEITADEVFSSDQSATGVITGIYRNMLESGLFGGGSGGLTGLAGLSADELHNYDQTDDYRPFELNELKPDGQYLEGLWKAGYKAIYQANDAIKELETATKLTPAVKNQLMGEAYFVRAFSHFYLVGLFGDVPLVTSTDHRQNMTLPRTPAYQVYGQMAKDLQTAQSLLPETYTLTERVRPNKWAATALLARVFLYMKDWDNAALQATNVLENPAYVMNTSTTGVFLKESKETIWQLAAVPPYNTIDGATFVITSSGFTHVIRDELVTSFETGDMRMDNWIGSYFDGLATAYFPYKYKAYEYGAPLTEHYVVLRLAEQYLIRAEARANKNDLDGARSDIDSIRVRAGLAVTDAMDKNTLLLAIETEKRHELFCEWAHRWFDLKRLNRADAVLAPLKSGTWEPEDTLYPVPHAERQKNLALTQNKGY